MSGQNQSADSELSKDEMLLDGLRRLKTHSPVYLLPRLILIQNLHRMLGQAQSRVKDGHRYFQHLLGEEVGEDENKITLQGDTTYTYNGSRWLPWLLTAGAIAAGGYYWWTNQPKPTSQPQEPAVVIETPVEDWRLGVIVTDQP